jgi:hypothetical protein
LYLYMLRILHLFEKYCVCVFNNYSYDSFCNFIHDIYTIFFIKVIYWQ